MYVHIFGYLVNKLEIWWVYLSPIEKKKWCSPRSKRKYMGNITLFLDTVEIKETEMMKYLKVLILLIKFVPTTCSTIDCYI